MGSVVSVYMCINAMNFYNEILVLIQTDCPAHSVDTRARIVQVITNSSVLLLQAHALGQHVLQGGRERGWIPLYRRLICYYILIKHKGPLEKYIYKLL